MERRTQQYIVTSRGRNRQHGILVTVEQDNEGDLHKVAHAKAKALSEDIRSYGNEISAFPVGGEKAARWSEMERAISEG